ncbi:MAG TPA: GNAT family N-acetyltransferase, partial [Arenibaculum sp.]|nr:GNAT family N-acetyltransferase [Arenibaculum sp.]
TSGGCGHPERARRGGVEIMTARWTGYEAMATDDGIIVRRSTATLPYAVRPCVESDLEALEWMGMFTSHREIIRAVFERHRRGEDVMLVADANGFPVGQLWIDFLRKAHRSTALLWAVRVFPPLRNLGIGRHLMLAAEEVVLRRNLTRLELGVEHDNPDARRFYERLGYRPCARFRDAYGYITPEGIPMQSPPDQTMMIKDLEARRLHA